MEKDRKEFCNIISDMLDSVDENGIYPTSIAFDALEEYMMKERANAIGWTFGFCCGHLDKGSDPRGMVVPRLIEKALIELCKTPILH